MNTFYLNFLYIFFLISLFALSSFDFATDNKADKLKRVKIHGIVKSHNSRLGGIIILVFSIISYYFFFDHNFSILNNQVYLASIIFIGLLGFVDDAYGGIHYLLKLFFLVFATIILFISFDQFLFRSTKIDIFNLILSYKIISFIISLIIIAGFTNALNISDGANGIASGIATFTFLLFYLETQVIFFIYIFNFILIFFIYNVIRGKLFLGDSGSYFLGFVISTASIYFYNENILSAGILATFLSYPSLEILYTIIRRFVNSANPLKPDDGHFHNLIYLRLKNKKFLFLSQNSYTGLIILSIFSFPGLICYLILGSSFHFIYWIIFFIQTLTYFLLYYKVKNK